jgi:hydroxymethylbilane synthase
MVEAALHAAHPYLRVERVVIATTGDKRPDLRFSEFTDGDRLDKGIFTKELEIALASGEIDFAVHSLKDVPTVLDERFFISTVLPRAPVEDVLISRDGYTLDTLPVGARVGTSSVRRIRQLQWLCPGVECVEIRGNVPTRVRKLFLPSDLDAILLAKAGLERLSLLDGGHVVLDGQPVRAEILDCGRFLPAAGQGAIGIEARLDDARTLSFLKAINHEETYARITAEREFLHLLQAGCQTPIGAHTVMANGVLKMTVRVFDETDPTRPPKEVTSTEPYHSPKGLAAELAALVTAL